ncbi:MAG: hypothetical protein KF773_26480 [Deltaproteobacteria bacterium]|nr:hypothetical protein [Deltaproteobacteria bacterium]
MRLLSKVLAAALLVGAVAPEARAWEPETTHGGLAEQAALGSRLHKRLVTMGFTNGLFEPLTIPPADAPALMSALKLLSPTHGAVPDARGRQPALGWIAAGAALADVPAAHGANHFFDPDTGAGWRAPDRGLVDGISDRVREAVGRAKLPARGVPAPDWVVARDNPFNVDAFLGQYAKAVTAATPGERSRHMAAALVAAGAILHTLGDLGAPSRVRGDEAAHFDQLGAGPDDLGSRFERIAALAYGRLGVPPPSRVVTRTHLRDFFTAKDGGGLADRVAHGYFSPNTLPTPTRIEGDVRPRLVRPRPALPARLNLMAASRDEGTILRDANGTCLARYRVTHSVLTFSIDDECMLEQLAVIVPEVAAYERGLLDFLLRGELNIAAGAEIVVSGTGLGDGTVELVVEDERGVRTKLASAPVAKASEQLASVAAPAAGARVYAVFRGVDLLGEPIVAVGAAPLAAR